MVKIVLINNQTLVRSGLRLLLETEHSFRVIGEAATGAAGIQLVFESKPNVVILEIRLPDISGLEVARRLLAHDNAVKILIVSGVNHTLFPFKLLEIGVLGYLTNDSTQEELIYAVKEVNSSQTYITPVIAQQLAMSNITPQSKDKFLTLSAREAEVMWMIIQRNDIKIIAKKLNVSAKTVHSYRGRIFQKLAISSDMELLMLALQEGIVKVGDSNLDVGFFGKPKNKPSLGDSRPELRPFRR